MSNISAALVKELRERTGAGMMDCKKALVETNGDLTKQSTSCVKKAWLLQLKKQAVSLLKVLLNPTSMAAEMGVLSKLTAKLTSLLKTTIP